MDTHKTLNKAVVAFLFCLLIIATNGCSPKIQQVGLRAPANMKIDGQTLEWPGNKLQAYNPNNRIEYTVCNDDENLYLIIRTSGYNAIDKIMYSGVIFTISHIVDTKEKDTSNITITFPVVSAKEGSDMVGRVNYYQHQRFRNDSVSNVKRSTLDSLLNAVNKKAAETLNELIITGVKEINDSLIYVSNSKGIKAMGQFNRKMEYTYELAIPLKYLKLSTKLPSKFSYSIKLNSSRLTVDIDSSGKKTYQVSHGRFLPKGIDIDPDRRYMLTTTKFEGEYTLAKKL